MTARAQQRGATLVVALIVLIVLTMFALSAYTTSSMNLRTSANSQFRAEAQNAAQEAIDLALSTNQFAISPGDVFATPCGAANTLCPDFSGDGVADYTVRLAPAPACVRAEPITMSGLDVTKADDLACAAGQSQNFGVAGIDVAAGDSLCANTVWELTAESTSTLTGARVVISQGVAIKISKEALLTSCL